MEGVKDEGRLDGKITFSNFISNLVVVCFVCLQVNARHHCANVFFGMFSMCNFSICCVNCVLMAISSIVLSQCFSSNLAVVGYFLFQGLFYDIYELRRLSQSDEDFEI